MKLFDSTTRFSEVCAGTPKWDRTLSALHTAGTLEPEVAHSVGDSLTYRRTSAARMHAAEFVGRRRYHLVVCPVSEPIDVEFAPQAALTALTSYDDLSDRQSFSGTGRTVTIPTGAVVIFDIGEAARITSCTASELVVLHVTVEGATFPNK